MSSAILAERDSYGWWRIDEEAAQDKRKRLPQRFIKIAAPPTIDYLISKGYSVHMQIRAVGGYHPTYYQSAKSVIFSNAEVFKSCIQWRFDTKSDEEVLQNIADLHIKPKSDASS